MNDHSQSIFQEVADHSREYKGVRITDSPQYRSSVETVKRQFIDAILENLEQRFPEESITMIKAFSVLAMRGLGLVPKDQLNEWGNEKN